MARILKTIKHRLKHRPALVAGVIVGAVAVLAIGACAMAASAVRPEDPVAVADEVVAALPEATAQTGQAAASQAQSGDVVDPRAVAEDARTALDAASGTEDVNLFNSVTGIARTLSSDEISDVEGAIAAYHDAGYEVGFVMYDLTTHEGVGYNADQWFFSASTVKAPFVAFASQDMVDGGQVGS